jgi:transposase
MDHFAGLDVSVKDTSVCIVDDTGKIVRELKVASEPDALLAVLTDPAYHFKRIGLEAGPLSQWLFSALAEADLPVICVETRHMRAVLKAQINKTDRNDARGIAQMIRVGLYRPVLYEAAQSMLVRSTRWSWLKAWAMQIARRRGKKKAVDEVCRRLMTAPGVGPVVALTYRATVACEDLTQSKAADAADPSQAFAVEGDCG